MDFKCQGCKREVDLIIEVVYSEKEEIKSLRRCEDCISVMKEHYLSVLESARWN